MSDQLTSFNARVKRINDPRNDSYLDPELGIRIPKRLSRRVIKTQNSYNAPKAGRMSIILTIFLGAFCVMAARYVRFNFAEIPDAGTAARTLLIMDFGLAAVMVFILGGMVKHKTISHMVAQVAGISVMLVSMHNLVWFFPAEFAQVYSQSYVDQVIAATEPLSIFVDGATISIL